MFADGGSRFEFFARLRPLGQLVDGRLFGAEHSGCEKLERLGHDLTENLRCGLDQDPDIQADEVDLVLVDEVPVGAWLPPHRPVHRL